MVHQCEQLSPAPARIQASLGCQDPRSDNVVLDHVPRKAGWTCAFGECWRPWTAEGVHGLEVGQGRAEQGRQASLKGATEAAGCFGDGTERKTALSRILLRSTMIGGSPCTRTKGECIPRSKPHAGHPYNSLNNLLTLPLPPPLLPTLTPSATIL